MSELVVTYNTVVLALAVLTLVLVVQSFISGLVKNGIKGQPAGVAVAGDISDQTFRIARVHLNGVENFSALFAATLLAMMVGVGVQVLTWLVLIAVGLRIIYWPIYVFRIGKDDGGLRSIVHVLVLVLNIAIALMAVLALI